MEYAVTDHDLHEGMTIEDWENYIKDENREAIMGKLSKELEKKEWDNETTLENGIHFYNKWIDKRINKGFEFKWLEVW